MALVRVADESRFKAPTFKYGEIKVRSILFETPGFIRGDILNSDSFSSRQLYSHVGKVISAKPYPAGAAMIAYPPALRLVIKEMKRG
jgi:hypothetical protein